MDRISREARSRNMSRIRSGDTRPELEVRKFLHSRGLRYRIKYRLPGKPDIVFPRKRIAVFVHGCFWHLHGCRYTVMPKTNVSFWKKKLEGNRERDRRVLSKLKSDNWKTITVWECDLKDRKEATLDGLFRQITETQE